MFHAILRLFHMTAFLDNAKLQNNLNRSPFKTINFDGCGASKFDAIVFESGGNLDNQLVFIDLSRLII